MLVPLTFPATDLRLLAVSPGPGLGPLVNSIKTILFGTGDGLRLNQREAASGTIMQLRNGDNQFQGIIASRILMISYYVDASNPSRPQLVSGISLTGA